MFTQMFGPKDVTCPLHPLHLPPGALIRGQPRCQGCHCDHLLARLTFWSNFKRGEHVRPAVECLNVLWLWMFICWSLTTSAFAPHDSSPACTDSLCWLLMLLCLSWSTSFGIDFDVAPWFTWIVLTKVWPSNDFDSANTKTFILCIYIVHCPTAMLDAQVRLFRW